MCYAPGRVILDATTGHEVLPWIGGVFELHAWPDAPEWRATFVESATQLIAAHPRFAGLHINIEPMPDGNDDFVQLLRELRTALPPGKKLSIAAYPPPTVFQRVPDVHWSEGYIRELAETVDQMVFMMYDTALQHEKLYIGLMKSWTKECLNWTVNTENDLVDSGLVTIEESTVAPWFGQPGGGVQYRFFDAARETFTTQGLIDAGIIVPN